MSFWQNLYQGRELVNILLTSEERGLQDRIEEYKIYKKIAVIGTLIIIGVCFGVMYIRFRVFGG